MKCWLIHLSDILPIDAGARPFRTGLLAHALALRGHRVVHWTSTFDHSSKRFRRHTQDCVLLSAAGPGAERFGGALRNTDVCGRLCEVLGITHRNPEMSAEAARAHAAAAPVVTRPDWA